MLVIRMLLVFLLGAGFGWLLLPRIILAVRRPAPPAPARTRSSSVDVPALTQDHELLNPEWPIINPVGTQVEGCASIRTRYDRTRCLVYSCGRCWPVQP